MPDVDSELCRHAFWACNSGLRWVVSWMTLGNGAVAFAGQGGCRFFPMGCDALAESPVFSDNAPWQVFVSHTSELRDFPGGMSYVGAVERAISAAGHVIVDMVGFSASAQAPAQV